MLADTLAFKTGAWTRSPEFEEIQNLAALCDPAGHAISFCFGSHSFPNRSHHAEALTIRDLIHGQMARFGKSSMPEDVSADISKVSGIANEVQQFPSRWRALYACNGQHVASEFALPSPDDAALFEIGRHFVLLPLLRAMNSCRQYRVVLIESGKARSFHVVGTEIDEVPDGLPNVGFAPRSEDSRVGWSNHIEGNLKHQEQVWFGVLAQHLARQTKGQGPGTLIVGCRADLGGELRPYLKHLETAIMGFFQLPGFNISANEVLAHARAVFED